MRRHNLSTVVRFEFVRTVKKKSFWVTALLVPIIAAVVFGLLAFSGSSAGKSAAAQQHAGIAFQYTDDSGIITEALGQKAGGTAVTDTDAAIADVKAGRVDAFIHIPAHPATDPVRVYGTDKGLFDNGQYSAVATKLLSAAVKDQVASPDLLAVAAGKITFTETMFRQGEVSAGVFAVLPPMLFLAVFYLVILFLGNQILNSTVEEKENRVAEMVLTAVNPTTLIVGKILAILATGAVQMLTFAIPVVAGYGLFRGSAGIPDIPLASLVPEAGPMITGALLLAGGFTLFASTLVAVGSVMPSAKEASGIFSVMIVLIFIPLYVSPLIASDPDSPVVQVFTYFPFSAPVTAMLRNGLGSLAGWEAAVVIAELFLLGSLMLAAAVKLFRHGTIQYTSRVKIMPLLRAGRTTA